MTFNSPAFIVFFAIVVVCTLAVRGRARITAFTVVSYVFYAVSGLAFLPLLFGASLIDYTVGKYLAITQAQWKRRVLLAISVTFNVGILATFKYSGFVYDQIVRLYQIGGMPVSVAAADFPLPPGISFYTFGAMSYTIDIYRRELVPAKRPMDFFCFVAFFPHLVAGPIVRAGQFLPQIDGHRPLRLAETVAGLEFVLVGLFKKMVVADNLAFYVERGFIQDLSPANLFLASVLFAVQIYCDFSGYTDVARGLAQILGFSFPENFEWPYFSVTIREFWRRWHMTLSFWIRDYVYIPLGGSRGSHGRRAFNVLVTWFLCGLWHGAHWRFVAWGLFNGLFVEASRYVRVKGIGARAICVITTFVITCFGWMLFRSPSLTSGVKMMWRTLAIRRVFSGDLTSLAVGFPYCGWEILVGVATLAVVHYVTFVHGYSLEGRTATRYWRPGAFALAAGVGMVLITLFAGPEAVFIYFAF